MEPQNFSLPKDQDNSPLQASTLATPSNGEIYDLIFIVDTTFSMNIYLEALRRCLPSVISISALTGCFRSIGLLGYRDYCDDKLLEWSGWLDPTAINDSNQPDLERAASNLEPTGGGDWPEALKTALARAYELSHTDAKTLCLLYTDAPPHVTATKAHPEKHSNYGPEQKALQEPSAYGGFGRHFTDWVEACKTLRRGKKRFEIFSFLPSDYYMAEDIVGLYNYLSTMTHGCTIQFKELRSDVIAKVTVETLLAWMGVEKKDDTDMNRNKTMRASLLRYVDISGINGLRTENDKEAKTFFIISQARSTSIVADNLTCIDITQHVLSKHIPKKKMPVTNFVDAWKMNSDYRAVARFYLQRIIFQDVQAMATNPVFGSLWRAVCNDRTYPQRETLMQDFSKQVDQIEQLGERERMRQWLEESYDFTVDISELIEAVPVVERFPCVCLDPTLSFVKGDQSDDDIDRSITEFTRAELLEVGRSCDRRVLARLSRILTRLTYIQSAADLPEHIAEAPQERVPRIPLALMSSRYEKKFWKILMHCILPGTLYSSRPAALVAALALSLGIEPLMESAADEMRSQRSNWNNIETPENWNVSCLSLLLDADQAHSRRSGSIESLLLQKDKRLFERLVAFHILQMNLKSPLTARIGWYPNKSRAPVGPLAKCRDCKFPRSVTIMQRNGICGICASEGYQNNEERARAIQCDVHADCNENSLATWVECFIHACRAQYVVYNVADLNVRPKCHYCRTNSNLEAHEGEKTPCIECHSCLSRIIWPPPFRPKSFDTSKWQCPACTAKKGTLTDVETTLSEVQQYNDMNWLVVDKSNPTEFPLEPQMQSLYKQLIALGGPDTFVRRIELFSNTAVQLKLRGKVVHNPMTIVAKLENSVARRQIGRDACSLCFSEFRLQTGELSDACGRRGCKQRVCRQCLSGWYGLNAPGKIINTTALLCPFCRKSPVGAKLRRFGNGVHAVAELQFAIARHGRWISAWCIDCGHAREYMERRCARGAPSEVENWVCSVCAGRRDTARREMEALRLQLRTEQADSAERERLIKLLGELQMADAKPCPSCGVMTSKERGCDHIECTLCKAHWCYYCGKASTWKDIYNHMSTMHSGYGIHENGFSSDEGELP